MLMHATITQNYLHVIARILGDPHAGERGFKPRLSEATQSRNVLAKHWK